MNYANQPNNKQKIKFKDSDLYDFFVVFIVCPAALVGVIASAFALALVLGVVFKWVGDVINNSEIVQWCLENGLK